jgi:hypothetical protein
VVEQRMTDDGEAYRTRVRARGFSSLQQISGEAFARGLPRFEAWSASLPPDQPVTSRWTSSSFAGSIAGHGQDHPVADQRAEDPG